MHDRSSKRGSPCESVPYLHSQNDFGLSDFASIVRCSGSERVINRFTAVYCFYFIRNAGLVLERNQFLGGECPVNPRFEYSVSWTHFLAALFAYRLEIVGYACAIISRSRTIKNGPGVVANDEQQVRGRAWEIRLGSNRGRFALWESSKFRGLCLGICAVR